MFKPEFLRSNLGFIFLILISIIPLIDLFHPGLPITHDGQDHVARIANFYQSLSEGNLVPRWGANLNWGYGHPVLMFLYPLQSYFASFFHVLGFSLIDSVKIIFGLAFIASGITMYMWVRNFLGEFPGLLAGILYIFAPYRFIDLYVRGALGEHVAFVFPPLILYFLLIISKSNSFAKSYKYMIGVSISTALLILSHNAISLMFLPFIILYSFYLRFYSTKNTKMLLQSFISIAFGFVLSAFFWVPAFFEGKYTLRDIVTAGEYVNRFIDPSGLIFSPWSYGITGQFSIQIGIAHWVGIILFPCITFWLFKNRQKTLVLYLITFIYLLVSIFLMVKESNFIWEKIIILQNFQFPWRFLSIVVFTTSILGALLLSIFNKKLQILLLSIFVVLIFIFNNNFWHAKAFLQKPESFFTGIYLSTTDTGESSPIWSVRFMEKAPKERIEVIEGTAQIKEIDRKSNSHVYEIKAQNNSRIRENTIFFPGWKVYIDKMEVPIQFQDPKNRGIITFNIPKGIHRVDVVFRENKLRTISDSISVISLVSLIIYYFINRRKNDKKN